jgi:hypothetical protein
MRMLSRARVVRKKNKMEILRKSLMTNTELPCRNLSGHF